MLCGKLRPQIE